MDFSKLHLKRVGRYNYSIKDYLHSVAGIDFCKNPCKRVLR